MQTLLILYHFPLNWKYIYSPISSNLEDTKLNPLTKINKGATQISLK